MSDIHERKVREDVLLKRNTLLDAAKAFSVEMARQNQSLGVFDQQTKEAFNSAVKAQLAPLTTAQKISVLECLQRDLATGEGACDLVIVITSLEIGIRALNEWAADKAHNIVPVDSLNIASAARIVGGH